MTEKVYRRFWGFWHFWGRVARIQILRNVSWEASEIDQLLGKYNRLNYRSCFEQYRCYDYNNAWDQDRLHWSIWEPLAHLVYSAWSWYISLVAGTAYEVLFVPIGENALEIISQHYLARFPWSALSPVDKCRWSPEDIHTHFHIYFTEILHSLTYYVTIWGIYQRLNIIAGNHAPLTCNAQQLTVFGVE